jgi:hypothetical protein
MKLHLGFELWFRQRGSGRPGGFARKLLFADGCTNGSHGVMPRTSG